MTNPEGSALFLATLAGLSALIGVAACFIIKKGSRKLVTISLGFAGGVMLSASFTDLLPEAVSFLTGQLGIAGGLLLGLASLAAGGIFGMLLEKIVPHGRHSGIEPGFRDASGETRDLYRVGLISALAFALHNLPEGMAMFVAGSEDVTLGVAIAVAVTLHNIPQGFSIAMPIWLGSGSRARAFIYTLLAGLAEPLGALIAFLLLRPVMTEGALGVLFGAVAGILTYMACREMIPASRRYGHRNAGIISILFGVCAMPILHLFGGL